MKELELMDRDVKAVKVPTTAGIVPFIREFLDNERDLNKQRTDKDNRQQTHIQHWYGRLMITLDNSSDNLAYIRLLRWLIVVGKSLNNVDISVNPLEKETEKEKETDKEKDKEKETAIPRMRRHLNSSPGVGWVST